MRPPVYALLLAYRGECFHGFQRQGALPTVELALRQALQEVTGVSPWALFPAGRTDAGVHAVGQVVSFKIDASLEPRRLRSLLNEQLQPSICVRGTALAPPRFHARARAVARRYRYLIEASSAPFMEQPRAWRLETQLDLKRMRLAARQLIGRHDFGALSTRGSHHSALCEVRELRVQQLRHLVLVDIVADRFLRRMVRCSVGLLVDIGCGKRAVDDAALVLSSRSTASATAPARGLYLMGVDYESCPAGDCRSAGGETRSGQRRSSTAADLIWS